MPDPLFHLSTALLPKALFGPKHTGAFVLGTLLPDLGSRLPGLALERVVALGVPIPQFAFTPWGVLHVPLGAALGAFVLAYAFHETERRAALAWLVAGVALHLGLDTLQFHHSGGYALLYPFSPRLFQIGVMGSESTVPWSAPLALVSVLAWGVRVRSLQAARSEAPPSDVSP